MLRMLSSSFNRVTVATLLTLAMAFAMTIGWTSPAGAVVLDSPDLPPEANPADPRCLQLISHYESGGGVHAVWPGPIDMTDVIHECFVNATTTQVGPDQVEDFDSTLRATVDDGSGPQLVELTGPVQTLVSNRTGSQTGTFDTEIVSMSLTGDIGGVPIEIRESPSLPSPGETTITDIGGGLFEIDSFFDVFVELSVNGGPFVPQIGGPSRMTLVEVQSQQVPTIGPLGLGLLATFIGLVGVRVRRRARS